MSPKAPQNTERINIFLSKDVLNLLKDAALKRGTNVSSLSRFIIIQWLLQQNILDQIGDDVKDGFSATHHINELQRVSNFSRYKFHETDD